MKIGDVPFRERPILELLHFDDARVEVDRTYAGYGWAHVPEIWLRDAAGVEQRIDDALVLGLHSADDGEALPDDIELEFELADRPVSVLATQFLAAWLPRLPAANAVVLAMCNPHRAVLPPIASTVPVYYGTGDVESWIDDDKGGRLELCADGSWAKVGA